MLTTRPPKLLKCKEHIRMVGELSIYIYFESLKVHVDMTSIHLNEVFLHVYEVDVSIPEFCLISKFSIALMEFGIALT
jgi:hypothetical protein